MDCLERKKERKKKDCHHIFHSSKQQKRGLEIKKVPVTGCLDKCELCVQWREKRNNGRHLRQFRSGKCTWWGVMVLNSDLIRQLDVHLNTSRLRLSLLSSPFSGQLKWIITEWWNNQFVSSTKPTFFSMQELNDQTSSPTVADKSKPDLYIEDIATLEAGRA